MPLLVRSSFGTEPMVDDRARSGLAEALVRTMGMCRGPCTGRGNVYLHLGEVFSRQALAQPSIHHTSTLRQVYYRNTGINLSVE